MKLQNQLIVHYMPHSGSTPFQRAFFGQGTGPIHLDNVACIGTESRLVDCRSNPLGIHNCGHVEDAGVRCVGAFTLAVSMCSHSTFVACK